MGMKTIIRNMRILPKWIRRLAVGNDYSMNNTETNTTIDQYDAKNTSHLMVVPTPYALPIVIPIYANERVVRELVKDHYYILP
ncbi:hypothetical protein [Vulcanisaeta sp. JCM 14467]